MMSRLAITKLALIAVGIGCVGLLAWLMPTDAGIPNPPSVGGVERNSAPAELPALGEGKDCCPERHPSQEIISPPTITSGSRISLRDLRGRPAVGSFSICAVSGAETSGDLRDGCIVIDATDTLKVTVKSTIGTEVDIVPLSGAMGNIEFVVPNGVRGCVSVRDDRGRRIVGSRVVMRRFQRPEVVRIGAWSMTPAIAHSALTDEAGTASFEGVLPGEYEVATAQRGVWDGAGIKAAIDDVGGFTLEIIMQVAREAEVGVISVQPAVLPGAFVNSGFVVGYTVQDDRGLRHSIAMCMGEWIIAIRGKAGEVRELSLVGDSRYDGTRIGQSRPFRLVVGSKSPLPKVW
ncbi:MAG: hypothetical protein ABIP94_21145 [Planctomycetota bacterium]